jgi:uncharacterized membrane protein YhaH (DUF805 family)
MTFLESIKTCFIDKGTTFSGRASRSEYWWFVLFCFLIGFFLKPLIDQYSTVDWSNRLIPQNESLMALAAVIFFVVFVFIPVVVMMTIAQISVTVRRLHDINRSGWWQLIIFVPIVGWIVDLYWMIKKGTSGPNRFGEDPLQTPHSMNTETESVGDTNHPAPAGHPSVGGEK